MALTQEGILTFLLEHGGRVKNSDLLNYFRGQINCSDPAEKQHNRDLFKKFVNSVAVVKQSDDVKFVVVKKIYQDFVNGAMHVTAQKSPKMDDSQNRSFSYITFQRSGVHRDDCDRMLHPDFENINISYSSNNDASYIDDNAKHISTKPDLSRPNRQKTRSFSKRLTPDSDSTDTATVKVLNISSDHVCRTGETGAVFAVIAVKSPPRIPNDPELRQDEFWMNSETPQYKIPENSMLASKVPSQTINAHHTIFDNDTPRSYKPIRLQESQTPGSPQLTRTQNMNTKQGDDAKDSEAVPLEPMAHKWLVKCASGLWGHIYGLLLQDIHLAMKKDFISGFTALHWAAKGGNCEMVRNIMDISKKKSAYVNVNSKAHGGYTPLHIAAIHGHAEVMVLLVQGYGAKVNIRDNNGKKPYHYLGRDTSAELKEILGGAQLRYRAKTEDEYRELPKGLNTITKIFQPHIGHRKNKGFFLT